jgi:hypothetical protein
MVMRESETPGHALVLLRHTNQKLSPKIVVAFGQF